MMIRNTILSRWLVYAALMEWLLARTITRLGIFMPKSAMLISVYQSLTLLGQIAATFAGLFVLAVILDWAWKTLEKGNNKPGVIFMGLLVFMSTIFLFIQPPLLLALSYQFLLLSAIGYTGWMGLRSALHMRKKVAIFASMLALQSGVAGHLMQLLGLQEVSLAIFKAGELFVLVSAFWVWMAFGRPASRRSWIVASLPAVAFTLFRLLDPATSGILAIWSTGMTLFLPWPFYTLSLWVVGVTVLACWRKDEPILEGILLLSSGGFAAQMTSHAFFGLVGLGLLGTSARTVESKVPEGERAEGRKTGKNIFGPLPTNR